MQSKKQPQGGRVGQAVPAAAPLYLVPGEEEGVNGVTAILFLVGLWCLCACSLPITLFFISVEAIQRNWLVALWDVI